MARPTRRSSPIRNPADPAPTRTGHRPRIAPARPGPWKHGAIPVLGLVGGIGAGKSLVAATLAERGALVLDADAVGHALLDQKPAREEVVARFGPGMIDPLDPSRIDRKALGTVVFERPEKLRILERILHPRMRHTFEKAIGRAQRKQAAPVIVLDAAILFEAGWHDLCDLVAFVEAPREVRIARIAATRGWTDEQLQARERAQLPLEQKRARADLVITNAGDEKQFRADLETLWRCLHDRKRPVARPRPAPAPPRPPRKP